MYRFVVAFGAVTIFSPLMADLGGSYQQSCTGAKDHGNGDMGADCPEQTNGDKKRYTTLPRYKTCKGDIQNRGRAGILDCARDGIPEGSYRDSCDNITLDGDTINLNCKTQNGQWPRTSIKPGMCKSGTIVNNNGQLTCEQLPVVQAVSSGDIDLLSSQLLYTEAEPLAVGVAGNYGISHKTNSNTIFYKQPQQPYNQTAIPLGEAYAHVLIPVGSSEDDVLAVLRDGPVRLLHGLKPYSDIGSIQKDGYLLDGDWNGQDSLYTVDQSKNLIRAYKLTPDMLQKNNGPLPEKWYFNFQNPWGIAAGDNKLVYVSKEWSTEIHIVEDKPQPNGWLANVIKVIDLKKLGAFNNDPWFNRIAGIAFDKTNKVLYVGAERMNTIYAFHVGSDGKSFTLLGKINGVRADVIKVWYKDNKVILGTGTYWDKEGGRPGSQFRKYEIRYVSTSKFLSAMRSSSEVVKGLVEKAKLMYETKVTSSAEMQKSLDTIRQVMQGIDAEESKMQDAYNALKNDSKDFMDNPKIKDNSDQAKNLIATVFEAEHTVKTYTKMMEGKFNDMKKTEEIIGKANQDLEAMKASASKVQASSENATKAANAASQNPQELQKIMETIQKAEGDIGAEVTKSESLFAACKTKTQDLQNNPQVMSCRQAGEALLKTIKEQQKSVSQKQEEVVKKLAALVDKKMKEQKIKDLSAELEKNRQSSETFLKEATAKQQELKIQTEKYDFEKVMATLKALEQIKKAEPFDVSASLVKQGVGIAGEDSDLKALLAPHKEILGKIEEHAKTMQSFIEQGKKDLESAQKTQAILLTVQEKTKKTQAALQMMIQAAEEMKKIEASVGQQDLPTLETSFQALDKQMTLVKKGVSEVEGGYLEVVTASQNVKEARIEGSRAEAKKAFETSKQILEQMKGVQEKVSKSLESARQIHKVLEKALKNLETMRNLGKRSQGAFEKAKAASDVQNKSLTQINDQLKVIEQGRLEVTAAQSSIQPELNTLLQDLKSFENEPKVQAVLQEAKKLIEGVAQNNSDINKLYLSMAQALSNMMNAEEKKARLAEVGKTLQDQATASDAVLKQANERAPVIMKAIQENHLESAEQLTKEVVALNPKGILETLETTLAQVKALGGDGKDMEGSVTKIRGNAKTLQGVIETLQKNLDEAKRKEAELKVLREQISKATEETHQASEQVLLKVSSVKLLEGSGSKDVPEAKASALRVFEVLEKAYGDVMHLAKGCQDERVQRDVKAAQEAFMKAKQGMADIGNSQLGRVDLKRSGDETPTTREVSPPETMNQGMPSN